MDHLTDQDDAILTTKMAIREMSDGDKARLRWLLDQVQPSGTSMIYDDRRIFDAFIGALAALQQVRELVDDHRDLLDGQGWRHRAPDD